ncbi:MAG: SUF system NifU family Fe-S cluster assembly protein [Micrococcales bacterium]|nr:SUF system NifU family Fe-S cluster assembly protein [Micrococcales bacterium]
MTAAELGALYQQLILDHARERHGEGLQPTGSVQSRQVNPLCGDEVTVQLTVDPATGNIASLHWEGRGCAISTASASLLADLVHELPADELTTRIGHFRDVMRSRGTLEPDEDLLADAVALQGVARYVARVKCAMLPWVACEDALRMLAAPSAPEPV